MNNNTIDASTVIITTLDGKYVLQQRDNSSAIEFPGFNALISGYIHEKETPLEAIIREIKEELTNHKTGGLRFSAPTYLGSVKRYDYPRYDYIHHAFLYEPEDEITLLEGKGVLFCSIEECLQMQNIAPHHKTYLQRYAEKIASISPPEILSTPAFKLSDLVHTYTLHNGKNLEKLENGLGFYDGVGDSLTELLHIEDDIVFAGYLQFHPNTPRGNHFHLRKVEYMAILDGELRSELRLYNNESIKMNVEWKRGQVMRLLPGAIHTLTAIGGKSVTALEFSPQQFTASDVYKL